MRKDHDKDSNRPRETEDAASHLLQVLVDRDVGHDDTLPENDKNKGEVINSFFPFLHFLQSKPLWKNSGLGGLPVRTH